MNILVNSTLVVALILSIVIPFGAFSIGEKSKGRYKTALFSNLALFFGIIVVSTLIFGGNAYAAGEAANAASSVAEIGLGYIAAGL